MGHAINPLKSHGRTLTARNGERGVHAFTFLNGKDVQGQGSQEMTNGHSDDSVPLTKQILSSSNLEKKL